MMTATANQAGIPAWRDVAHELHLLAGGQRPHYLVQIDGDKLATLLAKLPPQTLVRVEAGEVVRLLNLIWMSEREQNSGTGEQQPAGGMMVDRYSGPQASAIPPQYPTSAPALAPIIPPTS